MKKTSSKKHVEAEVIDNETKAYNKPRKKHFFIRNIFKIIIGCACTCLLLSILAWVLIIYGIIALSNRTSKTDSNQLNIQKLEENRDDTTPSPTPSTDHQDLPEPAALKEGNEL